MSRLRVADVVRTRVYLARREDSALKHGGVRRCFASPGPDADDLAVTQIHPECLVEIEAVALLGAP